MEEAARVFEEVAAEFGLTECGEDKAACCLLLVVILRRETWLHCISMVSYWIRCNL